MKQPRLCFAIVALGLLPLGLADAGREGEPAGLGGGGAAAGRWNDSQAVRPGSDTAPPVVVVHGAGSWRGRRELRQLLIIGLLSVGMYAVIRWAADPAREGSGPAPLSGGAGVRIRRKVPHWWEGGVLGARSALSKGTRAHPVPEEAEPVSPDEEMPQVDRLGWIPARPEQPPSFSGPDALNATLTTSTSSDGPLDFSRSGLGSTVGRDRQANFAGKVAFLANNEELARGQMLSIEKEDRWGLARERDVHRRCVKLTQRRAVERTEDTARRAIAEEQSEVFIGCAVRLWEQDAALLRLVEREDEHRFELAASAHSERRALTHDEFEDRIISATVEARTSAESQEDAARVGIEREEADSWHVAASGFSPQRAEAEEAASRHAVERAHADEFHRQVALPWLRLAEVLGRHCVYTSEAVGSGAVLTEVQARLRVGGSEHLIFDTLCQGFEDERRRLSVTLMSVVVAGAVVRVSAARNSEKLASLELGTVVEVEEFRGKRALISNPRGWVSTESQAGLPILERVIPLASGATTEQSHEDVQLDDDGAESDTAGREQMDRRPTAERQPPASPPSTAQPAVFRHSPRAEATLLASPEQGPGRCLPAADGEDAESGWGDDGWDDDGEHDQAEGGPRGNTGTPADDGSSDTPEWGKKEAIAERAAPPSPPSPTTPRQGSGRENGRGAEESGWGDAAWNDEARAESPAPGPGGGGPWDAAAWGGGQEPEAAARVSSPPPAERLGQGARGNPSKSGSGAPKSPEQPAPAPAPPRSPSTSVASSSVGNLIEDFCEVVLDKAYPEQKLGICFAPNSRLVLEGLVDGSAAEQCGLEKMLGHRLVRINGAAVRKKQDIIPFAREPALHLVFSKEPDSGWDPAARQWQPSVVASAATVAENTFAAALSGFRGLRKAALGPKQPAGPRPDGNETLPLLAEPARPEKGKKMD
ncbi:hypothetical protein DIPPA_10396 [Diplonema papillatum]|nr:hypothetical protein DIPPA_10396 [Diplonema papillatum]